MTFKRVTLRLEYKRLNSLTAELFVLDFCLLLLTSAAWIAVFIPAGAFEKKKM